MAVLGWKPRFLLRHSPDDLAVTEKGSRIPDDVPRWENAQARRFGMLRTET